MGDLETSKPLIEKGRFRQRIVICGSMSFYGEMLEMQAWLRSEGIEAIVPEREDEHIASLSEEGFESFKRLVSFRYLRQIRAVETVAILAVNKDKYGVFDYIGPNTFAEIAVAFAQGKRVYLLQNIPEVYADELNAWGVVPLDGSVKRLLEYYYSELALVRQQLLLFEDS